MIKIRLRNKAKYLLLVPALVLGIGIILFPLAYLVWAMFHKITLTSLDRQTFVGLAHFSRILRDPQFLKATKNTFLFVAETVTLSVGLGLSFALLVDRIPKGKLFFRTIFLLPLLIAPLVVALMWKLLYDPTLGVFNHILSFLGLGYIDFLGNPLLGLQSCILVDVWAGMSYTFMVLLAGLESLPREPFEAAQIDGASRWRTIMLITIPMLKPLIMIVVLFRIIWSIRVFAIVYALTGGGPVDATETMVFHIWRTAFVELRVGSAAAVAFIMVIMLLGISIIFIRYLPRQSTSH